MVISTFSSLLAPPPSASWSLQSPPCKALQCTTFYAEHCTLHCNEQCTEYSTVQCSSNIMVYYKYTQLYITLYTEAKVAGVLFTLQYNNIVVYSTANVLNFTL